MSSRFKITLVPFILAAILIATACILGSSYFYKNYCELLIPAKSEFGKSPVIDQSKISEGFTLFTSLNVTDAPFRGGTVYLIDLYGRIIHTWRTENKTQYVLLKPNGNLLTTQAKIVDKNFPQAARITSIQELDPNSNVVWEYKNEAMHHDFDVLPNGNLAVLIWEKVPDGIAQIVKGGKPGTEFNTQSFSANEKNIFSDVILEVDRDKNVVWSWKAVDHLDPNEDEIPPFFNREQWTHANSIKYVKSDPFFQKEAYLVSMRYLSTIFLISKETGEVIWKSPKGLLGHQHDATLLENGDILVFNNAFQSTVSPTNPYNYGSSVLEIDPKANKVVWEFSGGNNALDKARLINVILSGAQRLPNGNTLITLGTSGRIIEVTPDKRVVWDMINPYSDPTNQPFPSNYIFKSRRYYADQVPWLDNFGHSLPKIPSYCGLTLSLNFF